MQNQGRSHTVRRKRSVVSCLIVCVFVASCDFVPVEPDPTPSGAICYADSDCAPNACCGQGTAIVHASMAPDCRAVSCDGSCPVNGIRCGCAVPVCRDSRCTSAISPDC